MDKMKGVAVLAVLALLLALPAAVAQEAEAKQQIKSYIDRIFGFVAWISGALAALLIALAGLQYMLAGNPADKQAVISKFRNLVIGLAVVSMAGAIAKLIIP